MLPRRSPRAQKLWTVFLGVIFVLALGLAPSSTPQPASAEDVIAQLGDDIDGEAGSDQSGFSVSMSSDGTRVAIGAPENDKNGSASNAGHVRVYQWNGSAWIQLGNDIDGEVAGDKSGLSVSLSGDGTRLAIGAPEHVVSSSGPGQTRIYEWDGTTWTQLGGDIDGEANRDDSGWSVSLNSDGSRVAIGARFNDENGSASGQTRIYEWDGTTWTQLGSDIDGDGGGDESGYSVSLNSDGSRVAIGAPYNTTTGTGSGNTRIYQYDGITGDGDGLDGWTQLGQDLLGAGNDDAFGYSVSLSSTGNRVAVGAFWNAPNGPYRGAARIYEYNSGTNLWVQLGSDIDGEAASNQAGHSVSLSSDGTRIAIGAPSNDDIGTDSGHTRIFDYDSDTDSWTQIGDDIDGEAGGDKSGFSVALAGNGTRVAVGAPYNDGNGANSGQTRVFAINIPTPGTPRDTSTETIIKQAGEPGIFLTLSGRLSDSAHGFDVLFGAYAVAPSSPFVVAVRNDATGTQRLLASGVVSSSGHLEDSLQLPQLAEGAYTITVTARGSTGALLTLGNRLLVNEQGKIQSMTPETLQPTIR